MSPRPSAATALADDVDRMSIAPSNAPADGTLPSLMVPIADIVPSPLNPRKHFDIVDLIDSVRTHGVLMPLLTRPRQGRHEIIEGERRYRAAQAAGVLFLEVKSRELSDDQALEVMLLANGQREDLTPLEEARGYNALLTSNPSRYSLAYIADRISRSEKYVADRMRLLELIPELQALLDQERIGVGLAEVLAKLKPADQQRAASPGDREKFGRSGEPGGLWVRTVRTLDFDEEDDEEAVGKDPYAGLKAATVKELEAWIARHVRFDVDHAAKTAPLDFGNTALLVETAQQQPGRGRKVISITEDYRLEDDAKDGTERVYGRQSWKRADGTKGTSRGGQYGQKAVDSPTCDHSVLGLVVVGPGQGTAFQVCIARDRCDTHWKTEIKEREQRAKKAGGLGKAKTTRNTAEDYEAQRKREEAERLREAAAYKVVFPQLVEAITKAIPSTLDRTAFEYLYRRQHHGKPPAAKPAKFIETLVLTGVQRDKPTSDGWGAIHAFGRVLEVAKAFKVNVAPMTKAFSDHVDTARKAATAKAEPAKGSATAKAGKKPAARKAAKKR